MSAALVHDLIERVGDDYRDARRAARETFVECVGCGTSFRGQGLLCRWCINHSRASIDAPRRVHGRC